MSVYSYSFFETTFILCLPSLGKFQIMHVLVTSQVLHPIIKVLAFKVKEHAVQSRRRMQQLAFNTKGNGPILIIKRGSFTPFLLVEKKQHDIKLSSDLLLTFRVKLVNEGRLNFSDAKQTL